MHPLPLARALALDERPQDALGQEYPGREIRDGNAHAHRTLPRQSRDRHETAHPLRDLVIARPVAVRPGLAEARDAAVDQSRVYLRQGVVIDAEPVLDVGAEVLDIDIGPRHQALEDLDSARRL